MPSYMIISGVGVPLRRGFVLPRVATRWLVALPSSSMPPTGRKEASDFWPCPSTGQWGCSRPRWLRRWPTRPGQLPSVLWQISTDQVQRGAGEALWSHPGRRPCCRPPCSPAQRGCPGDITDVVNGGAVHIFGNLIRAGAELSAQRGTAKGSQRLLADLPFPGWSWTQLLCWVCSTSLDDLLSLNRSCFCSAAARPPSTLRAGLLTGLIALVTLRWKMVGFL